MDLLTPHDGELLLRIARSEIEYAVSGTPKPLIHYFPVFEEKRGVFVTLTRSGQLRGCIGLPYPVMPLGEAIVQAATSAALEDPRFPPVKKEELSKIHLEVTVSLPFLPAMSLYKLSNAIAIPHRTVALYVLRSG